MDTNEDMKMRFKKNDRTLFHHTQPAELLENEITKVGSVGREHLVHQMFGVNGIWIRMQTTVQGKEQCSQQTTKKGEV